jgi:hypothetical protein
LRARIVFFAFIALIYTAPGMLPGRRFVPLDIPSDYLAWKHDPAIRVRVSNSLLSDVPTQLVPWDIEARRLIAQGELPWRNRFAGDGEHLFANPLAALLSPFTWPRLLFGLRGWPITVFLKLLVAMLSMYWFARSVGGSDLAATMSGLVFALSGYSIVWALYPHTNVFVFLPALAASAIEKRYGLTALIAALATAGGHPETLAVGVIAIFIFIAFERRALLASLAGFLLLGIQLVPFAILMARSHIRFARLEQVAPSFRKFTLPALFLPGYLGTPLRRELDLTGAVHAENFHQRTGAYIGALALIAILLTFRRLQPVYRRALWIAIAALALSISIPGIAQVLQIIPLVKWIAFDYYACVFVLFASLAAGRALEIVSPPRALAIVGIALVIGGLVPVVAPRALERVAQSGIERLRASGHLQQSAAVYEERLAGYLDAAKRTAVKRIVIPGFCFLLFAFARGRSTIAVAVALELFIFGIGYNPSIRVEEIAREPDLIASIPRDSMIASSTIVFPPNMGSLFGVRNVRAYDILTSEEFTRRLLPAGYDALRWEMPLVPSPEQQRALAGLGVRYYIAPDRVIEIENPSPMPPARNAPPDGLGFGIAVTALGALLMLATARGLRRSTAVPSGSARSE